MRELVQRIHPLHELAHKSRDKLQRCIFELIILITITLASSNNTFPDDSNCTETCRSCFNVNFNILLNQLSCASVGKDFDNIKIHGMTENPQCNFTEVYIRIAAMWIMT